MSDRTNSFYALDAAIHGYGAQILIGNGASPEVFEAVAAVVSITPGEMSTEDIKRSHLRSPDAHHEHQAGMRDSGPFTIAGTWLPAEQSQSNAGGGTGPFISGGLIKFWRDRTTRNVKIVLNDGSPGTEWPFRGYVAKFQPGQITLDAKVIDFTAAFQPTQAYDASLP